MARTAQRRGVVAAVLGLILSVGSMSAPPAAAHTFTKSDGNDSPGRLDIKSASVKHGSTSVIHTIKTYEGWSAASLEDDSDFVIAIDKNFDDDFELCAIVLYVRTLRAALTNCGSRLIRTLSVSKPSATTVKVRLPEGQLTPAYRWVAFSFWTGAPARCANTCVDTAPNSPPPILHDLTAPKISNIVIPQNSESAPLTADSLVSFQVSDGAHGAGVRRWSVERRPLGETTWTEVASGSDEGPQDLAIPGSEGSMYEFRIRAEDLQGNRRISATFESFIPFDDETGITYDGPGGASDWTDQSGSGHFLSGYHESSVVGATFDVTFEGTICFFGGPTAATVNVTIDGVPPQGASIWSTAVARDEIICYGGVGAGSHALTAEIASGTVVLDAYLVYPA